MENIIKYTKITFHKVMVLFANRLWEDNFLTNVYIFLALLITSLQGKAQSADCVLQDKVKIHVVRF